MVTDTNLVQWERIKAEITQCEDINEMGKMNYSLEAIQKWARQSKQSLETQNAIAEYRLRLNRKQGDWIEKNIPEEGAAEPGYNATENSHVKLSDIGIDKNDSPKFRILARIPDDKFENYIKTTKETGEISTNDACRLWKVPHVSQNTGENEWYTPPAYIKSVLQVMGSIDTDPASSEKANEIVQAEQYFTIENDGRKQVWHGNVWMNPPYSQPLVTEFCNLLVAKVEAGEVKQACVLVNNATETNFYQGMMSICKAICFIKGRVKFIDKNGNGNGAPLQGQTILYFGNKTVKFADEFSKYGVILYANS